MSTEAAGVVQAGPPPGRWNIVEVLARLERLGFAATVQSAAEIAVILESTVRPDR